jgi:peptidoglycan hydrolase CwlO-like protein
MSGQFNSQYWNTNTASSAPTSTYTVTASPDYQIWNYVGSLQQEIVKLQEEVKELKRKFNKLKEAIWEI